MQGTASNIFANIPPAVKGLLIINVLLYALDALFSFFDLFLAQELGLFYFGSPFFKPYQLVTHLFMHGSLFHLFFNMYALWMFGKILEFKWGANRFLIYFFVTGLGAAILHNMVIAWQFAETQNIDLLRIPVIGASGAVFGLLLAFGMLFPNVKLMLIFIPIPIKAKYFVIMYGLTELYMGFAQYSGDNIAHFAHLGGMIFGFILLKIWRIKPYI